MKLWTIDVRIYATAYIKAETEAEAQEIAAGFANTDLEFPNGEYGQDFEIYGGDLDVDNEALPDVSFSPAMTVAGIDERDTVTEA